MTITYTEDTIADIVEAIIYLNDQNPALRADAETAVRAGGVDYKAQAASRFYEEGLHGCTYLEG